VRICASAFSIRQQSHVGMALPFARSISLKMSIESVPQCSFGASPFGKLSARVSGDFCQDFRYCRR
jgi:hypothetical protein